MQNSEEVVLCRIFNSKRAFDEGIKEIKYFYSISKYKFECFNSSPCFGKSSSKIHYGVNVIKRKNEN